MLNLIYTIYPNCDKNGWKDDKLHLYNIIIN